MTTQAQLEITFRGVEITDDTVHFARRCGRLLARQIDDPPERILVMLERPSGSQYFRAHVALAEEGGPVGTWTDWDELLALNHAFAVLGERLRVRRASETISEVG